MARALYKLQQMKKGHRQPVDILEMNRKGYVARIVGVLQQIVVDLQALLEPSALQDSGVWGRVYSVAASEDEWAQTFHDIPTPV